ncbi:SDR family oxidoreductase [Streptomyces endophyticus]|uniref:SDR family oxidoreductase n=1 Tax=Streptomyces endophyticus TaxID=714166 RepID=A0ABU6EXP8_9ACTN|nr:SDR family oxidoreductase [Streptomyces endophyticus]MEB8336534.1 SDR family oxidoreductase [Streptomyces endophyticus]
MPVIASGLGQACPLVQQKVVAVVYGAHGIRVISLVVGTARTEMVSAVVGSGPVLGEVFVVRRIQRRMAGPRVVAEAALWLLSDRSLFAAGARVAVGGGFLAV